MDGLFYFRKSICGLSSCLWSETNIYFVNLIRNAYIMRRKLQKTIPSPCCLCRSLCFYHSGHCGKLYLKKDDCYEDVDWNTKSPISWMSTAYRTGVVHPWHTLSHIVYVLWCRKSTVSIASNNRSSYLSFFLSFPSKRVAFWIGRYFLCIVSWPSPQISIHWY